MPDGTVWEHGRFDARGGPRRVLFGRVYEDARIELDAFGPGGRVFCIASAGDTALELSRRHEVVAVDINPVQLDYTRARLDGAPMQTGMAERVMALARAFAPLAGWTRGRLRAFCDLDDLAAQQAFWRERLDTWRFRFGLDLLLSVTALRAFYSSPLLDSLPPRFGRVLRQRFARTFAAHPNRDNEFARALLLGELVPTGPGVRPDRVQLVHQDAASYLEACPAGGFDGISLSNIVDGASPAYVARLFAAARHAARPEARIVVRSFGEPRGSDAFNVAARDRSMLWGVVDVRPVRELDR